MPAAFMGDIISNISLSCRVHDASMPLADIGHLPQVTRSTLRVGEILLAIFSSPPSAAVPREAERA